MYQLCYEDSGDPISRHLSIKAVVNANHAFQCAHKRRTAARKGFPSKKHPAGGHYVYTICKTDRGEVVDDIRVRAVALGATYTPKLTFNGSADTIGDLFEALYRHFGEETFQPRDVSGLIEKDPEGDIARALQAVGNVRETVHLTLGSARDNIKGRLKLVTVPGAGYRMQLR